MELGSSGDISAPVSPGRSPQRPRAPKAAQPPNGMAQGVGRVEE